MRRREKGVTLIALVVTIIVLLILAGITLGSISDHDGIINRTKEAKGEAERESIIEKIEADLYNEKVKTGKIPNKEKLKEIIDSKYGTTSEEDFVSTQGNYTIEFAEIIGWEDRGDENEYRLRWYGRDDYTQTLSLNTAKSSMTYNESNSSTITNINIISNGTDLEYMFHFGGGGNSISINDVAFNLAFDNMIKNAKYELWIETDERNPNDWAKPTLNGATLNGTWERETQAASVEGRVVWKFTFVNTIVDNQTGTVQLMGTGTWTGSGLRGYAEGNGIGVKYLKTEHQETSHYTSNYANGYPFKYGDKINLTEINTLYQPGQTFKGWNTSSDGTGEWVKAGEDYRWHSDIELYGIWE